MPCVTWALLDDLIIRADVLLHLGCMLCSLPYFGPSVPATCGFGTTSHGCAIEAISGGPSMSLVVGASCVSQGLHPGGPN